MNQLAGHIVIVHEGCGTRDNLSRLLDLARGWGDSFGTVEEGYFLVPRVNEHRPSFDVWRRRERGLRGVGSR